MLEPKEDDILRRAKEMCWADGKIWMMYDPRNRISGAGRAAVVDELGRAEYLNRARLSLQQQGYSWTRTREAG